MSMTIRLALGAAALLALAGATPSPTRLLPLSDRDTTTGESGCESAFTQGNTSLLYVQNATMILRTAPGAGGRKLCRLTQAQQESFGDGPTAVGCAGLRLSVRHTGRATTNEASDSSDSPAALTIREGARVRVLAGRYGTAC